MNDIPEAVAKLEAMRTDGGDWGGARFLEAAEREASGWVLSPVLLPVAERGGELFALYLPPEPLARSSAICSVDRKSGVWAPVTSNPMGRN